MMKVIKVGKRYTTVVFTETIYSCGRVMYMENEEYLIVTESDILAVIE